MSVPIQRENGIVIALTAIIIVALVGVVAMLVHYGYLSSVQTELQAAADSAALTATGRLNTATTGWSDAREAAVRALNEFHVLSGVGDDQSFNLSLEQVGVEWDLADEKNLKVRIERGLWMPAKPNAPATFTSFEGEWQTNNPGIPRYAAANAVRVSLERPKTRIFGSPFGGVPEYSVSATSIALRGPMESVCVAPFAIPVCALLDKDGEFQREDICQGDRLFTRVDRYCADETSDAECLVRTLPSTPYTPISSAIPAGNAALQPFTDSSSRINPGFYRMGLPVPTIRYSNEEGFEEYRLVLPKYDSEVHFPLFRSTHDFTYWACIGIAIDLGGPDYWFWRNQQTFNSSKRTDHYGVFGLPGESGLQSELEGKILDVFALSPTHPEACVKANIGDPFQVLENGLTRSEADGAIWTLINGAAPEEANRYSRTMLGSIEGHTEEVNVTANLIDGRYVRRGCPPTRASTGVCNSHRGKYELVPIQNPGPNPDVWEYNAVYAFKLFPGISDESTVWRAKVPVIAAEGEGVGSCEGMEGVHVDPRVSAAHPHKIIGFVDAIIYDVDIGNPPPDYPIATLDNASTEPFPAQMRFQENCNNVRARITCESQFIPTSDPSTSRPPRLVTGATDS